MPATTQKCNGMIRIGTRGSPLALWQAHETRRSKMSAHGLDEARFEIVVIKTSGDRILDRPLSEVGGKGLFTKEIDEALSAGSIDIAVCSLDEGSADPAARWLHACRDPCPVTTYAMPSSA